MGKLRTKSKPGLVMACLAGLMMLISARAHAQEASEPTTATDHAAGSVAGASGQTEAPG